MKYLTYNGHQLVTKNKLQAAVQECLKSFDRILIEDNASFEDFKIKLIAHIVFINNEHPRCKPVRASWFELDKNEWLLSGVEFNNFMIYHVKKDYKSAKL